MGCFWEGWFRLGVGTFDGVDWSWGFLQAAVRDSLLEGVDNAMILSIHFQIRYKVSV